MEWTPYTGPVVDLERGRTITPGYLCRAYLYLSLTTGQTYDGSIGTRRQ